VECGKTGKINITQCPLEIIPAETWDLLDAAELYEKGLPPVAGGQLDQSHGFFKAAVFIMREKRNYEAKR
jgi:hypothetical protein